MKGSIGHTALALLGLLCAPFLHVAWAADAALAPSPAMQCLTTGDADAAVEYPADLFERKDGGTVPVELTFTAPDRPPRVKMLNEKPVFDAFLESVSKHVRRFRIPCMSPNDPPVVMRDRKSTRLNSSHSRRSRMPSSA